MNSNWNGSSAAGSAVQRRAGSLVVATSISGAAADSGCRGRHFLIHLARSKGGKRLAILRIRAVPGDEPLAQSIIRALAAEGIFADRLPTIPAPDDVLIFIWSQAFILSDASRRIHSEISEHLARGTGVVACFFDRPVFSHLDLTDWNGEDRHFAGFRDLVRACGRLLGDPREPTGLAMPQLIERRRRGPAHAPASSPPDIKTSPARPQPPSKGSPERDWVEWAKSLAGEQPPKEASRRPDLEDLLKRFPQTGFPSGGGRIGAGSREIGAAGEDLGAAGEDYFRPTQNRERRSISGQSAARRLPAILFSIAYSVLFSSSAAGSVISSFASSSSAVVLFSRSSSGPAFGGFSPDARRTAALAAIVAASRPHHAHAFRASARSALVLARRRSWRSLPARPNGSAPRSRRHRSRRRAAVTRKEEATWSTPASTRQKRQLPAATSWCRSSYILPTTRPRPLRWHKEPMRRLRSEL